MRELRNDSRNEASDSGWLEQKQAGSKALPSGRMLSKGLSNVRIALIVVSCGLALFACSPKPTTAAKVKPVMVEHIEGTELNRIILTDKAAQRIGIQTVAVKTEKVERKRRVGGEVVAVRAAQVKTATSASSATPGTVRVRVALTQSDLQQVNRSQPARVLSLDDEDDDKDALSARPDGVAEDGDADEVALQYVVNNANKRLAPGQRVYVELSLGSTVQRSVVPYSAVVYDVKGDAWVYTQSAPLNFVRHQVMVDYIDDDLAVLAKGPPAGTAVVTVGVAELFGSEFGIGK